MKKFQYKLQPLLQLRKFQEKKEFANYAKVLGEINRHRQKISESQQARLASMNEERKKMQEGLFYLEEKQLSLEYYRNLAMVQENAEKEIEARQEENEALRQKAEKSRQNRRILEILKEKQYEDYLTEVRRVEYSELDEFNQRRKGQKGRNQ